MCAKVTVLVVLTGWGGAAAAQGLPTSRPAVRHVAPDETWELRDGRFCRNGQWVFLKVGKILRAFEEPGTAEEVTGEIDAMVDKLDYNCFSLNIYPDRFDADADGRVDRSRLPAYAGIGRILDHCWKRGVFCALSFETYNIGGGGTPEALFRKHPDVVALNALLEPARDVEYGATAGKLIPSIFHPAYLTWSRDFIRGFLSGIGKERATRLFYIETTVEPQYLGQCNVGDRDERRAALDFSEAARSAFEKWRAALPANDRRREAFRWPADPAQRDRAIGHAVFNEFRGGALGRWVSGDIAAVRSVAPAAYVAVDYNGRFDDPRGLRVGDHDAFLTAIEGADIIQVAPHIRDPWGDSSWEDVARINRRQRKNWAVSEHMTVTGVWPEGDREVAAILENTLARGTRWGWEFVNAGNRHKTDSYHLYREDWTSPITDVVEGPNWDVWLRKIGAPRFVPRPRGRSGSPGNGMPPAGR